MYETLPGWQSRTRGIPRFEELPGRAQAYLLRLAELSGAPFALISTGPERNETILDEPLLRQCGLTIG